MRWSWRSELVPVLLIAFMAAASAWAWQRVPEPMPVHWNLSGEVDGWGGRFQGLALVPLIALAVYAVFLLVPRLDPGRANYPRFRGPFLVLRGAILVLMAIIHVAVIVAAHGRAVPMDRIIAPCIGALFVVVGLLLGKIRPNWFVGIRTPWTLSSKRSWTRSHRLGGWLFLATGLITLTAAFAAPEVALVLMIGCGAATALGVVVYSYFVWRGDPERIPPAGTSPGDDG